MTFTETLFAWYLFAVFCFLVAKFAELITPAETSTAPTARPPRSLSPTYDALSDSERAAIDTLVAEYCHDAGTFASLPTAERNAIELTVSLVATIAELQAYGPSRWYSINARRKAAERRRAA